MSTGVFLIRGVAAQVPKLAGLWVELGWGVDVPVGASTSGAGEGGPGRRGHPRKGAA